MNIEYHQQFLKHYKKRIDTNPKLIHIYERKYRLWLTNPQDPSLKDHQLTGQKLKFRAFWISWDVRVVYQLIGRETVQFYDFGSHNQVY